MKPFEWNEEKNQKLKEERNISFEEAVDAIEANRVFGVIDHPNKEKYKNQKMFIIEINNYAYLVPYVETEEKFFLKTIFPNREATKKYITSKLK